MMRLTIRKTAVLVSCVAAVAVGGVTVVAGAGAEATPELNVVALDAAPAKGHVDATRLTTEATRLVDPNHREGAPVHGVTVRIGTSSVDLTTDGALLCSSPTIASQNAGSICSPLPLSTEAIPFQVGQSAGGAWVAAIAPDGVVTVSATGDNGETASADIVQSVAIVAVEGTSEIREVSWTTADGRRFVQVLGEPARAATP